MTRVAAATRIGLSPTLARPRSRHSTATLAIGWSLRPTSIVAPLLLIDCARTTIVSRRTVVRIVAITPVVRKIAAHVIRVI